VNSVFRLIVIVLLGVLLGSAFAGCVDLGQVESMRSEAVKLREALQADTRQWESRVASLPETDPLRADAQAALAAARARLMAVDVAVLELDQIIKEARNPSDPIVSLSAPLLPEPLRSPFLLGGALLAMVARTVQLKRGMASIARSFDKAMQDDEQLRAGVKRNANTIRSIQTPTAQKIVDQVTGKRRGVGAVGLGGMGLALPI